jgi:ABC-type multidrug transport system permease subunit
MYTTFSNPQNLQNNLLPTLHFAGALLKGNWRDRRGLVTALFSPLLILMLFWLLTGQTDESEFDLLGFMFPAIVGFGVMFSGGAQATRLLNWREQGVFQRLAATPVPLGHLVLGATLAQTILGMLQGILILLFGVLVIRIPVNFLGALATIFVLALGGACFIALGSLIATFADKADAANNIYTFSILPMFFLGGGFPPEILPAFVQKISPWLPTSMFTELIRPLLLTGVLPQDSWVNFLGLTILTILFATIAARRFQWKK